jgi:hypothetical protein
MIQKPGLYPYRWEITPLPATRGFLDLCGDPLRSAPQSVRIGPNEAQPFLS